MTSWLTSIVETAGCIVATTLMIVFGNITKRIVYKGEYFRYLSTLLLSHSVFYRWVQLTTWSVTNRSCCEATAAPTSHAQLMCCCWFYVYLILRIPGTSHIV